MTIEELKEKERELRIADTNAIIDRQINKINEELQRGEDYVDVIVKNLNCYCCPFKVECDRIKTYECSKNKCQYLIKKYIDKPIVKMSIDTFLDKHLDLLRAKLKKEALRGGGGWDNLSIYIQVCDTCPLKSECTNMEECTEILQKHISLSEVEE